ncbi:MAG: hypothetical protein D3924_09830 [Candidatus Electrothrix sp. AR4]|nr:hypothetical protein [Candidatus Electrothrix sp. AR4]
MSIRGSEYGMKTGVLSGNAALPLLTACLFLIFFYSTVLADSEIALNKQEKKIVLKNEIVVRELESADKAGRTFEAVGIINARRSTMRQILLDYKKYPEFMPNVSRIEIIQQDENSSLLTYHLTLPLGKKKKYRIRMEGSKPDAKTSLIRWRLQEWPGLKPEETIKDTNGFWRIEEQEQGRSLVLYHVYTDPGPVPFGLGWVIDILSKDTIPEVLSKTKNRAERFN